MINELEVRKDTNNQEEGASLVEYALLIALIAVIAIAAVSFVGTQVSTKFSEVGSSL
ncbi:Flp family type IVb pilin [Oligoflexia bacterium]|nr:Flp family type IVb pilin [Oligoflexia bacterium]